MKKEKQISDEHWQIHTWEYDQKIRQQRENTKNMAYAGIIVWTLLAALTAFINNANYLKFMVIAASSLIIVYLSMVLIKNSDELVIW